MSSFVAIFCFKCSNCSRVTKLDVVELDVPVLLEQMDLCDLDLSGITEMLVGMLGVLMEVESSSGSGLGANVAGGVFLGAFISLEVLEAGLDLPDDLGDFPFIDLDDLDLFYGGSE